VQFKNAKDDKREPAPVFAPFEISKQTEDIHKYCCCAVIWEGRLKAVDYEVPDARTTLPLEDTWPKALIGESSGGVEKCVLCLFKVDEVGLGGGGCRGEFVGVVDSC
jgi:hypothetical protein